MECKIMKINHLSKAIRTALGLGAVSLTFSMMLLTEAQAVTTVSSNLVQWTGNNSGDWIDSGNWIVPPAAGSDVLVTDGAVPGPPTYTSVTYTNLGDLNPGSVTSPLNSLLLDGSSANNMTLNQYTDNLSTGNVTIGDGGTGTFNQGSNGVNPTTTNISGNLILGNQAAGNGTYTVNGDTSQTNVNFVAGGNGSNPNGALIVGNAGTGSFTQGTNLSDNGNQVNVAGDLTLGHQSGSFGTYLLNSGTLTVGGQTAVGGLTGSTGTFTQNGGTLILTNSANQPTVNPDYASVPPGSGAFGGKLAIGGGISSLGGNDGGSGTYNLTGGLINATANGIEVGPTGNGTMNQSGGTVNTTYLTEGFSGTGTYNLSGTGTINSYSESVGYAGTGTFNQSGGTHTIASDLRVGVQYSTNSPGNGTYSLSNGVLNSGNTYVGQGETGSIVVSDFTTSGYTSVHNVSGNLILGTLGLPDGINPQPSGNGSYSITGNSSQLNVNFASGGNAVGNPNGALIIGSDNGSTGTFVQGKVDKSDIGNQVNVAGDLVVGLNAGSQGTYTLNAGTLTVGGAMTVGAASASNNQFIQNGGTVILNGSAGGNSDYASARTAGGVVWPGSLIVGGDQPFSDGVGTYALNSGTLNASSIYVGYSGTGNFNQNSGTVNASYIDLGDCGGCNGGNSFGKYTLTGDGAVNVSTMNVGDFGHGEFVQNGATSSVAITGDLNIGNGAAAHPNLANPGNWDRSGSYTLNAGTLSTNNTIVGSQGVGTFTQNGGQHVVANTLTIGQQWLPDNGQTPVSFGGPAPGTYTMTAGTLTANGLVVGDQGVGTFTQTGGVSTVTGNVTVAQQAGSNGSSYNLSGGSLQAASMNVNTGGTFNYSGGSFSLASGAGILTNDGQVNINGGGTRTVDSSVVNDGTFKVTDTNVTYTGTFTNNGAYISDPATNTFINLTISSSGYLQGGAGDLFILSGNLSNGSTQTGLWNTSLATLDFTGAGFHNANFGNSSSFQWGTLMLDAGVNLALSSSLYATTLDLTGGYAQLIALLESDTGGYIINVGSFDLAGVNTSYADALAYLHDNYQNVSTSDLNQLSSVPEPGSLMLLGIGLAGLLLRRRLS